MGKDLLCHESKNKFNVTESGLYVEIHINKKDTKFMIIYRLADTKGDDISTHSDISSTMNNYQSNNYFLKKYRIKPVCVAVFSVCGDV